uniref:PIF1/LRR1 pleckstrin homology domain-containing protein n=1 Tax=Meloidogyne enterolobii TaxID=390850 RepID=A0A6V7W6M0_MELEN|nr:unnamed protein product [Meloidogyne enterolobii]
MSSLDCALRLENLSGKLFCRETRGVLVLCSHACGGKEEKRFLRIRMQNSSNNRQIELGKNCLTIWRSHIKQGKATIQFKEDNLMLYISMAKYEKLRSFLSQIENIDVNSLTISPSKQQSTSSFVDENRFRTKMSILKLKDYPKNDGAGFPKNLQQLYINNIKLQNVDIRWFSLRSLSILSLVDNNLGKNWTLKNWRRFCSISNLEQLKELDLSKNPLKIIPDCFIDALPLSLSTFCLKECSLVYFSNNITRLRNLQYLNLSKNLLKELPEDFYLLPRLTKLQISYLPYLEFLPVQLLNRQILDEIDVTDNHLLAFCDEKLMYKNKLFVPKLVDLASAALLNNRNYWVNDGSQLLRNEILECLPADLRKEIRKCLLRCDLCLKLKPSSLTSCSFSYESIDRISHIWIGPTSNLVRTQLCTKCGSSKAKAFSLRGDAVYGILLPLLG